MAKLRFPQFAQAQKHRWIENHRWLRLALLAAAAAFSVLFALRFAGHVDHFILIWPASGVFIAFSLRYWRPEPLEQAWSILAGAVGVFVGGLAVGMPGYLALQIALLTAIDAWIAGWLLGGRVSRFDDLKRTENVMRLGLATLIGPILTGVLGAIPLSHFLHAPFLFTAAMNSLANSLGIALLVPLLLFFLSGISPGSNASPPAAPREQAGSCAFSRSPSLSSGRTHGPFSSSFFLRSSESLSRSGWKVASSHLPRSLKSDGSPPCTIMAPSGSTPSPRPTSA
jgi:hypothetical protein